MKDRGACTYEQVGRLEAEVRKKDDRTIGYFKRVTVDALYERERDPRSQLTGKVANRYE